MNSNQKKILENILKNLNIKKGNNIYLGLDFFKLYKLLDIKKVDRYEIVDQLLMFFLSYLGKKGNLVIPVFNFDCVRKKETLSIKSNCYIITYCTSVSLPSIWNCTSVTKRLKHE